MCLWDQASRCCEAWEDTGGPRGYRGALEDMELVTSEQGTMFRVGGAERVRTRRGLA